MITKTAGMYRTTAVGFAVFPFMVLGCSKKTAVQMHQVTPVFRMCCTHNSVLMNMSVESSSLFRLLLLLLQRD